jgi:hypothetical protein
MPASPIYSPPTQKERFNTYIKHTYGIYSILEAGARSGIDQALDRPSEWPEGAQGYADRFGSKMGHIAIRGTTEYVVSDILREDIRRVRCASPCSESTLQRAFDDTFMARKGEDGHHVFSIAHLAGPITASVVEKTTWYPSGYRSTEIVRETGISYGFQFIRNYIRELAH